jgi:hypothetical protein
MLMRFVPIKSDDQLDLQSLHRVRERWVMRRTAVINQIRGLLLERGITLRKGRSHVDAALPGILEDADAKLWGALRMLLAQPTCDTLTFRLRRSGGPYIPYGPRSDHNRRHARYMALTPSSDQVLLLPRRLFLFQLCGPVQHYREGFGGCLNGVVQKPLAIRGDIPSPIIHGRSILNAGYLPGTEV